MFLFTLVICSVCTINYFCPFLYQLLFCIYTILFCCLKGIHNVRARAGSAGHTSSTYMQLNWSSFSFSVIVIWYEKNKFYLRNTVIWVDYVLFDYHTLSLLPSFTFFLSFDLSLGLPLSPSFPLSVSQALTSPSATHPVAAITCRPLSPKFQLFLQKNCSCLIK